MFSQVKNKKTNKNRSSERGNVLFLILIAVALFAALSYAVTQSTRGGGGSASRETDLISSAQITQYPATLKTGIIRMLISGQAYTDLEFNLPSDYENCTNAPTTHNNCVFHPDGGGSSYSPAPSALMANTLPGPWYFNLEAEVENISTSDTGAFEGNDLIAFLPGITLALCNRINEALAISGDTILTSDQSARYELNMTANFASTGTLYSLPSDEFIIGTAGGAAGLDGQPFGCFTNGGAAGAYVYYHVLVEQ